MSTAKTTKQRSALLAAVEAGDVAAICSLLDAGVSPDAAFKTRTGYEVALALGEEALVQPFIDAFLRGPLDRHSNHCLSAIANRVFEDDRFSAAFAGTLVAYVAHGLSGERAQRHWDTLLAHGLPTFHELFSKLQPRVDEVLAGKVALAIADGWLPVEAWREGWLPHHEYLRKGWVEAAVACVAGGAKPDEPTRRFGLESPEAFVHAWPTFLAAVREQRVRALVLPFLSPTRTRQRA